ncbi:MAG: peptidyl-tRNA hydrolase [Spongiibacteraceae bacterium]|nr:peptidyl-tRNA hydrolase [Spongiibacteraceae bacterium]
MKQVIIVNASLKLPKGKLAAQVAHASVSSFLASEANQQQYWLESGMPKVVLSASDEEALLECYENAISAGLAAEIVRDAGKTVLAAGTLTCIGIGPALSVDIDKITGNLKLL